MFWYLYMVHNVRAYIGDLVSGGRVRYRTTKPFENLSTNETAYIRVRTAHTTSLYTVGILLIAEPNIADWHSADESAN